MFLDNVRRQIRVEWLQIHGFIQVIVHVKIVWKVFRFLVIQSEGGCGTVRKVVLFGWFVNFDGLSPRISVGDP